MKLSRRSLLQLSAGVAVAPAISNFAWAQDYPSRPIKIIVPYVAGGPTDVMARMAGEIIRVSLGQPVVIENVPGATGTIAVGRVIQSPPDGYTLSVGTLSTHVLNGALFTLKYDLLNDLQPIALLPNSPFIIASRNSAPPSNLREFIGWIKSNPGKITFGNPGLGSTPHVATVRFAQTIGVEVQSVQYRGAGPSLQDLIAGQIDAMFGQPSVLIEQISAGRIKGHALTARTRLAAAPEIPTVDEAGLPAFYAGTWNGIWAPRGTSAEIVAKLNTALVNAMNDPVSAKRFTDLGLEIPARDQQTPEALGSFQKAEIEKWWPLIRAANIKGE